MSSIEFDTRYVVHLISPTPTDKNMIMYQLKPFRNIIFIIGYNGWHEYRAKYRHVYL